MIRVAFTMIGGKKWVGGYNYLLNLLRVITRFQHGEIHPVLFLGTDIDADDLTSFRSISGVEIITSPLMNKKRSSVSLIKSLLFGADLSIKQMFNKHNIDVIFENARFFGKNIGIPTIAWIPDLQHRELPDLFSWVAWWKRELGFRVQIANRKSIMLSSNDARDSFERYYPKAIGRSHVVKFAVLLTNIPTLTEITKIRKLYGLPKRYFYMPNQFWQHKNHLLSIEALDIIQKKYSDIVILASGKQIDPNKPQHFQHILSLLKEKNLHNQFRLLSLIPYEHIAPIMLGSVAVLNPSLFEGWSTTVEEARALGVPMILSDIPVHIEQAYGIATFFNPHSAKSFANTLEKAWQKENKDTIIESNDGHAKEFARNFAKIAKNTAING